MADVPRFILEQPVQQQPQRSRRRRRNNNNRSNATQSKRVALAAYSIDDASKSSIVVYAESHTGHPCVPLKTDEHDGQPVVSADQLKAIGDIINQVLALRPARTEADKLADKLRSIQF